MPILDHKAQLTAITQAILKAKESAQAQSKDVPDSLASESIVWPIQCTVGPGLEGAIACESKVGYVNGSKGNLVYRGYSIFDLCAYSNYEEVSWLLMHGRLPSKRELRDYQGQLRLYWHLPKTIRQLAGFPVEEMNPMAALRLGTNLMRQRQTYRDHREAVVRGASLGTDEDSIPMETVARGEARAVYEFDTLDVTRPDSSPAASTASTEFDSCYHLIAGIATILASYHRLRIGHMPLGPRAELSHAANLLYMLSGEVPDPVSERIMDICLILHADHGMNASTFASMVVASTLSDIYFSVGAGIGALNGPLHGGANQEVLNMLKSIDGPENVDSWFKTARAEKFKIPGFGHRVYKTYDPRALILAPLAEMLSTRNAQSARLFATAQALDVQVSTTLGVEKGIFPNVDFYSGLVYESLGIPDDLFTAVFAVSRMAGWTARIIEYLQKNRIFRPRALYTGKMNEEYISVDRRSY